MNLELTIKRNATKRKKQVHPILYKLAEELYNELESIGIIDRLRTIPQLGVIRVKEECKRTRYEYMGLQVYLHQIIKQDLSIKLKYGYSGYVKPQCFDSSLRSEYCIDQQATIGELLQIMVIIYNIGHVANTFVASQAELVFAQKNIDFQSRLLSLSNDKNYKECVIKLIFRNGYDRFHLLRSFLVLEHCDCGKPSVQIAKALLMSYMKEDVLDVSDKLRFIFEQFRSVRDFSFIAFDLQVAETPLYIDLGNEKALKNLLEERLSAFNDRRPMQRLFEAIAKTLDDTVYYEESHVICYHSIARRMIRALSEMQSMDDYYNNLFLDASSILNRQYPQRMDFDTDGVLKLTFSDSERDVGWNLFRHLDHMNGVKTGFYNRRTGELTILVSIKKSFLKKQALALRILSIVTNSLRRIKSIALDDVRFLLCTKFTLHYIFGSRKLRIDPTVSEHICVICTKGKRSRIVELDRLLKNSKGDVTQNHEVLFMRDVLANDVKNDICLLVPSSIIVFRKSDNACKLCEFDGLVLFPNRKKEQIAFLEAKYRRDKASLSQKCLSDKLNKLNIPINSDDIILCGRDAYFYYSFL